jgi:hypothetical protein
MTYHSKNNVKNLNWIIFTLEPHPSGFINLTRGLTQCHIFSTVPELVCSASVSALTYLENKVHLAVMPRCQDGLVAGHDCHVRTQRKHDRTQNIGTAYFMPFKISAS